MKLKVITVIAEILAANMVTTVEQLGRLHEKIRAETVSITIQAMGKNE